MAGTDWATASDLSAEFANITGEVAVQAYAQVVYTATEYETKLVRFLVEGKVFLVATDGETKEVVNRDDYLDVQPRS